MQPPVRIKFDKFVDLYQVSLASSLMMSTFSCSHSFVSSDGASKMERQIRAGRAIRFYSKKR